MGEIETQVLDRERIDRILPMEQLVPLVLEILPGQAGEGLLDVFEPGTYGHKSIRELVDSTLARENWSIEERQLVEEIGRQLFGGKLLVKGREVRGSVMEHAVLEETEEGEKYLYVAVRAVKPQEGGASFPGGRA